jgi:prepilin-type N-terminal cleavage/methylation domain-containing protein
MYKRSSRGFTLIELLVVIAIIGILSAVVLASLNTARQKGQNAAVQSDLSTIQTQAEIYYGDHGNSYNTGTAVNSTACSTATAGTSLLADTNILNAVKGAKNAAGADGDCVINATGYMFSFPLSGNTGAWCIDSTGYASDKSKAASTAYANVAATYSTGVAACQ